ncbi:MAG: hypothetical protein ACRC0J_01790, partial [Shewanella oncorhynchi]
ISCSSNKRKLNMSNNYTVIYWETQQTLKQVTTSSIEEIITLVANSVYDIIIKADHWAGHIQFYCPVESIKSVYFGGILPEDAKELIYAVSEKMGIYSGKPEK